MPTRYAAIAPRPALRRGRGPRPSEAVHPIRVVALHPREDGSPDAIRRGRQARDPHADRVVDRAEDRRSGRDERRLPHALGAVRPDGSGSSIRQALDPGTSPTVGMR